MNTKTKGEIMYNLYITNEAIEKLMGGEMPSEYYTALAKHLMNMNWGKKFNAKEARNVISDAIRFMVTSSFFMIQK